MKVRISQSQFASLLGTIQSSLTKKFTMPVLAYIHLSWSDDQLKLSATDLAVSVTSTIQGETEGKGEIAINLKMITELIRELPDSMIELSYEDGARLRVIADNASFLIIGIRGEEYPQLSGIELPTVGKISRKSLSEMLGKTLFAASQDESKYNLVGVYFEPSPSGLRFVATDGHRLSIVTREGCSGITSPAIVPRRPLIEIKKLIDDSNSVNDEILINQENGFIVFEIDNTKFAIRLIDGDYPDYASVIPVDTGRVVRLSSVKVLDALRRVSLMISDQSRGVSLLFEDNLLRISASSPDLGDAQEIVEIDYTSEPCAIGCNSKYFADVLNYIGDGGEVTLHLLEGIGPIRCYSSCDESALAILMPMRSDI